MKTAMIFAAGRGERLKPFTDTCPKALCMVRGMPLIEHHIQKLASIGFETIVINLAHLGGMIRDYVGNGSRWNLNILYSAEPPGALETGGALVHAQTLLGDEPFITINADIFTDYQFRNLSLSNDKLAHLVLVERPTYYTHADFGLSNSLLSLENKQYTFTGIGCYSPKIFEQLIPGRFSIANFIKSQIPFGTISAEVYKGVWLDIGTPERLSAANRIERLSPEVA